MEWSDEAIVLGGRAHGEAALVLELMTRDHGRHLGLVHGGRSRRLAPALQAGNGVQATWRARLDEQLGHFTVEPDRPRAARLLPSALALHGLATIAHHLRLLPERDPHPALYEAASDLLDRLDDPAVAPASFVRFELLLLAEMGYGLDLASCAATGVRSDLRHVSPRSGRAVSGAAGEPYRDRLLPLPTFLRDDGGANTPGPADVAAGLRLTGFFVGARLYEGLGRPVPDERARFVAAATASGRADAGNLPP